MSDSLEASMMKRIGELKAENARLKAEVARLTKAGDNLAIYAINRDKDLIITEVEAWNFAKEEQP